MSRGIPVFPTLFTSANLLCGVGAITLAIGDALRLASFQHVFKPFELSAWLILVAVVLDGLDGLLARGLKAESRFGAEYDSLADIVSFGVAPAVALYLSVLREYGRFAWVFVSIYIMCGAVRLARFNVSKVTGPSAPGRPFRGLPIPGAAAALSSYVLLSMWGEWHVEGRAVLPLAMVLVSLLMISSVEYPRLISGRIRGRVPFMMFVAWSVVLVVVAVVPLPVVTFAAALGYLLGGPVGSVIQGLHVRRQEAGSQRLKEEN